MVAGSTLPDSDKIDDLKKKFLIDDETYDSDKIARHLERLVPYCRVTAKGRVEIKIREIPEKKKTGLVIVARYIANKLDSGVNELVAIDEISLFSDAKRDSVMAYASELVKEGICSRPELGKYRANPGRIDDFIDSLDGRKQ